jgi:CHAT domain-containing protein
MACAGKDFPATSTIDQATRPLADRARARLLEAYRLALATRAFCLVDRCAFDLVCLDVLEKTADSPTKEVYHDLAMEWVEEALAYAPRRTRFLDEGTQDPVTVRRAGIGPRLSLGFCIATELALLADDVELAKKLDEEGARVWQLAWAGVRGETFRLTFANDDQPHYHRLVTRMLNAGLNDEALNWTERLRSQALLDLIKSGVPDPRTGVVNDVRRTVSKGLEYCRSMQSLLRIDESVRIRAQEGVITGHGRSSVDIVDLAQLRGSLPPDTCILSYFIFGEDVWVWVIDRDKCNPMRLPASQDELRRLVGQWRVRLYPERARGVGGVRPLTSPPSYDSHSDTTTRRLHDLLIRPIQTAADPYGHWCVVPHDCLKRLPFAALSDGEKLCGRSHSISYAAGLTVLHQSRNRRPKAMKRIVCLGNPDVDEPGYELPHAEVEVKRVAALMPESRVFVNEEATLTNLLASAGQADILHVASHSVPVDEHGNRALLLSPSPEYPAKVQYFDLYQLRSPAFLACLSACGSGLGEEVAGDEVLGLSRGFLAAGIPTILISLWDVPDATTADLMEEFYRRLSDNDPAVALQKAQLAVSEKHPAPWHWAAFVIYGDWAPPAPDAFQVEAPNEGPTCRDLAGRWSADRYYFEFEVEDMRIIGGTIRERILGRRRLLPGEMLSELRVVGDVRPGIIESPGHAEFGYKIDQQEGRAWIDRHPDGTLHLSMASGGQVIRHAFRKVDAGPATAPPSTPSRLQQPRPQRGLPRRPTRSLRGHRGPPVQTREGYHPPIEVK